MSDFLSTDIKYLKGVGESRAKTLNTEIEVATFRDLIYYFPFRHIDKSRFYSIAELAGNDLPLLQIKGRFLSFREEGEGRRKRLVAVFSDGKKMMEVVWFNKYNYIKDNIRIGQEYVIFGKPTLYRDIYSMAHPEIELYDATKLNRGFMGVYSLSENMRKKGFTMRLIRNLVSNLLSLPHFENIEEVIPEGIVKAFSLMPLKEAFRQMHFPENAQKLQKAVERFKFEELFYVQLNILRYSLERSSKIPGLIFKRVGKIFNSFYRDVIPFELTGAQKRVLNEIWSDMKTGRQMNRLLQGDVGSGKTMVAFMTMLMAVENGYQGAMMAPTEILAQQHYETTKEWAEKLGLKVVLLTGNTKAKERRLIDEGLKNGEINIIVGTHALIEDNVVFKSLGVVIIDEQHRFGVAQRAKMWKKGEIAPHVLVMTATPIPRTLAMTVYGDLDVSVIDELPPGRKPVTTLLRYDTGRQEVDRLISAELKKGHQIYIVYPLIQENEKLDLKSLEEGWQRTTDIFYNHKVCMVHGKMKKEEKDQQMDLFARGEADIMVATTVIEVGVNVPNASVMIIENAERFGLSQLHQLRGRVGRGAEQSYCVLMSKANGGSETKKRLSIMTETNDGFLISEADMKIRGPGDMEGTQQSGLAFNLRVADLVRDGQILEVARKAAYSVLISNPDMLLVNHNDTTSFDKPNVPVVKLNEKEKEKLKAELRFRFSKTVDWSLIS